VNALRVNEVTALLVPVLIMPLDLMGEYDPEMAQRIRDATRALEQAIADERQGSAIASASQLFTLLLGAWARGLLEFDELEGLVDLLSLLAAELRGAAAVQAR
jgi:hypothetical protein